MKKIIILIAAMTIGALYLSSCSGSDEKAPTLGATVNVTVKNMLGTTQEGRTVYMYKNHEVTDSTAISDASKQVVTNANGIATFNLNFTELNILESQTTLYFAVFYTVGDENYVAGTKGITVKRGDVATLIMNIPL